MSKKTVVICGATGHQVNAVERQMLKRSNWEIVPLSRNPDSVSAQAAKRQDITLR